MWPFLVKGHRVFAGKIDKQVLSFTERAVVSALRVAEGEFRDWDGIASWSREIGDARPAGQRAESGSDHVVRH